MSSDPSPEIEQAKAKLEEAMRTPEGQAEIQRFADELLRQDRVLAIRRSLLSLAAREARAYETTIREVLHSFALADVRPELQAELDTQIAALGVPAALAIETAERIFGTDDIGIGDLLLVVQAYAGEMPTPPQAREIELLASRLAKVSRRYAKRKGQAEVAVESLLEADRIANPIRQRPAQTFHRTQARTVSMPGRGISR